MGHYLAFDLGAESGRAISGTLHEGTLAVEELHRFPNEPLRTADALCWDTERLWGEVQRGIRIADERGFRLDGIGIDTWGVDYGLLDASGKLLENPRHYRDARNNGMMETVFARVPREEVFSATGIQFMQFNTLFQLYAAKLGDPEILARARRLLNMPDLFNYWLTGEARSEATIASTTQFFSPVTMSWATGLLARLDLPCQILCPVVMPGTALGKTLTPPHTSVYATAGHDTASAVAAVPTAGGEDWCYISSGTWSLMGLELDRPVIGEQCLALNFTNEVGVAGKIRLLKNIAGLWLLQECRRAWMAEGIVYSYEQLARMAAGARPHSAAIDPDAFLEPGEMPRKIAEYCRRTGQEPPATHAEYARAILESLALRYRHVLESLEILGGRKISTIHIVGGGSRNAVLNQFVADATGRRVVAGPAEATAIGNILVEAMGAGELESLDQIRSVVRRSFPPAAVEPHVEPHVGPQVEPHAAADWERAYECYRGIVG
ncbi:MAG: rhamnulokinase [Bryobacteraceae bacterium]